MSNASLRYMNRDSEEEALSSLLDGELSEENEEEIRRRMAEDPDLAARCAELAEVDGLLQKLAEPLPEADRLQRMHGDLRARIEAEANTRPADGAEVIALAPRRRSALVGVAAALAAALALYLALGPGGAERESDSLRQDPLLARTTDPEPVIPEPAFPVEKPVVEAEAETAQLAQAPVAEEALAPPTVYPEEVVPVPEPAQPEEARVAVAEDPQPLVLPDSDERLAIALDYEMLADFDVISNLELLEYLGEIENLESM